MRQEKPNATPLQPIRLFVASPGDVQPERQKVDVVAAKVNRTLGDVYNVHVQVLKWETHVVPGLGRPQGVVNDQIDDYDIFVGIMWKRFGTETGVAESGTKEEFDIAFQKWQQLGYPRIMFYFSRVPYFPESAAEAEQMPKVMNFSAGLQKIGICGEYKSIDDFAEQLENHLTLLIKQWFKPRKTGGPERANFTRYLTYLHDENMYLDIRGLATGNQKLHQFRIDELYIPLKTSYTELVEKHGGKSRAAVSPEDRPREVDLAQALTDPKLTLRGEPGSGKTTFLRLVAFTLCQKWLGEPVNARIANITWPTKPPLPILVRLGRLAEHIRGCRAHDPDTARLNEDSPECLLRFLADQSRDFNWQVTDEDFRRELTAGNCLILLDGLDEAPDKTLRETLSALAANLLRVYAGCRVVLTSRPGALVGEAIPAGFQLIDIAPLNDEAMQTFLQQWTTALYPDAPESRQKYRNELGEALQARPDIRRMARTPVMLTALAVVHWNEHRLPEQRVELYESIIGWLLRQREKRPGRLKGDKCRQLLQKLALGMFTEKNGRQKQLGPRRAAEILAPEFEKNALERAEYFLRDEMIDSGIILMRGDRLEFWHLSFQEYLAAAEVAGKLEQEQHDLLFQDFRLYHSEWKELVLLLAGILYKQGLDKINHFIDAILERCPDAQKAQALPEIARKVALCGGIIHDLSPFEFQPANTAYPKMVQQVLGIFNPQTFRQIPVKTRIEAADALGRVGDPRLPDDIRLPGDHWIQIPAGAFWMGAQKNKQEQNYDPQAYSDESPVHRVELDAFQIGKFPVTVGQFRRFIDEGGYAEPEYWTTDGFGKFQTPDKWEEQQEHPTRPVVYVSWYEAVAFARWAGGRLPTEAEWERAARGPGDGYRIYPWGDREPDAEIANWDKSQVGHATPVGIFPESCSPEGVLDLAGNVWEWCQDWFGTDYYATCRKKGTLRNPAGPEKGDRRVLRGGSFFDLLFDLRCSVRYRDFPDVRYVVVGFRVVRVP